MKKETTERWRGYLFGAAITIAYMALIATFIAIAWLIFEMVDRA
jgi:hypothetical protein